MGRQTAYQYQRPIEEAQRRIGPLADNAFLATLKRPWTVVPPSRTQQWRQERAAFFRNQR